MDTALFESINGLAGHVDVIDDAFQIVGQYGQIFLIAFLGLMWFRPNERAERDRQQWTGILAALSAAVALGVNQIIIRLWDRPRPFALHPSTLLLHPSRDPSFPSDHATFGFAVAIAVVMIARRAGIVTLFFALILGFARVYTGEHYVSDVLGGAVIGGLVALLMHQLSPFIQPLFDPPLRLARRLHLA